jgi:hypothetical protein
MKNLLLIPMLVFVLTSVNAATIPTIISSSNKTFVLNTNDWNQKVLNIAFLTNEGIEIYSEKIHPNGDPQKYYNLQILKKGSYRVMVSCGTESVTYDIEVTENSIAKISEGIPSQKSKELSKDIKSKIKFINS